MVDFKFIASTFGGGWLVPLTDEARETYANAFDETPRPLGPIGGQEGWVIGPRDLSTVMQDIRADGFTVMQAGH